LAGATALPCDNLFPFPNSGEYFYGQPEAEFTEFTSFGKKLYLK